MLCQALYIDHMLRVQYFQYLPVTVLKKTSEIKGISLFSLGSKQGGVLDSKMS